MASRANFKLIVLQERELRIAAKTITAWRKVAPTATNEQRFDLINDMVSACAIALHGCDTPGATIVVANIPKENT
jgi:hypothetical protein